MRVLSNRGVMVMKINYGKAVVGGLVGTVVLTVVGLYAAPMMGIPQMNPAAMLAGKMGGNMAAGWVAHFMVGVVLALIYAAVASRLPGAPWLRGAIYGIAPWLVFEIVMLPMMGMPLFSGSMMSAMGALIGHLLYGATVGAIYGPVPTGA
ncbi:MAG TPA: DUF6789 family protein [Gemmatimonadaceae bacterium]|nr:DUF6789 family protein [Gemmatimonadaceae bacterium]